MQTKGAPQRGMWRRLGQMGLWGAICWGGAWGESVSAGGAGEGAWVDATVTIEGTSQRFSWEIGLLPEAEEPLVGEWPISELKWRFGTIGARVEILGVPEQQRWLLWGWVSGQGVVGGTVTDRDWDGPNRSLEKSYSVGAVRGWTGQSQLRVGALFGEPEWAVSPYLGWSGKAMSLRDQGLEQRFVVHYDNLKYFADDRTDCLAWMEGSFQAAVAVEEVFPCSVCVSTFHGWANGLVLGLGVWAYPEWEWQESAAPLSWRLDLNGGFADWVSQADWCLRDDFAHPCSFQHQMGLWTASAEQQVRFEWKSGWWVSWGLEAQGAWAIQGEGRELIHRANGARILSQVRHTRWTQAGVQLGVGRLF